MDQFTPDLINAELQSLDLLHTALKAGADKDVLITSVDADGSLARLLGTDPTVLALENLTAAVGEKAAEVTHVFWTKRKKIMLAAAAAVTATLGAAILLTKKGNRTHPQPLYTAPTPKEPERPKPTGKALAPIPGQGVKSHLRPPDHDFVRYPPSPEKYKDNREYMREIGDLSWRASCLEGVSDHQDSGERWKKHREALEKTSDDSNSGVPDEKFSQFLNDRLNVISRRLNDIILKHSDPSSHTAYKLMSPRDRISYVKQQDHIVKNAKTIGDETLALVKKIYGA